jgi:exodeoxyribonuclease-3
VEQFPHDVKNLLNFELHSAQAQKKGYSGVATFSRQKILDTKKLGDNSFDNEGRTLIHDLGWSYLLNCYFPNGQRDHNRVPYKLDYCRGIQKKIRLLRKKKPVIITGDFNTAHHPIDLANPVSNKDTTGFLLPERAWVDGFVKDGMIDIFRHKNPELAGAYTWWSNRPGCRARNVGWRIDYFFISPELLPAVKKTTIHHDVLGSDHCPISLELNLKKI